jgi:alpha-beta hydrolase superfamily lysophospholipase
MQPTGEVALQGVQGRIQLSRWDAPSPRFLVVLVHGYAEHAGRYPHVARALVDLGAVFYAADHRGHGRSDGEPALVMDIEHLVADTEKVVATACTEHPDLPLVLIAHTMGGLVATRYAQQHGDALAALVLSGPAIGGNPTLLGLLELAEIPDVPLDPETLSRDPEVGRRYAEDPLVYRGPFKRRTLEALAAAVDRVARSGDLGPLPTLWIHGAEDALCPLPLVREAIDLLRGSHFEERVYPGARHEVFNETNQDEVLGDVAKFLERTLSV